jgi:predicted RNA-binding protein with PUA-like domain
MMNKLVVFYRPDPDPDSAYPHWSYRDPDLVQNVPDPLTLHAVNQHGMFTRSHFLAHTAVQGVAVYFLHVS